MAGRIATWATLVLATILATGWVATATADDAVARRQFVAAERALKQHRNERYRKLKASLRDYPLYPYLEYQELRNGLERARRTDIDRFLQTYADTPLANQLRSRWLRHLAAKGRWRTYLDYFQATPYTRDRCDYLNALIESGDSELAFTQVPVLWLVGKSQPKQCDPVFRAWREAGLLTQTLVWDRIELAMAGNQTRLARYLGRFLPASEKKWVERWLRIHRNPKRVLDRRELAGRHPRRNRIVVHAIRRLAARDYAGAVAAWERLRQRYELSPEDLRLGERALALAAARAPEPDMERLARIPAGEEDVPLQQRRILTALKQRDWPRVAAWIEALPTQERTKERWRYWLGRSQLQLGSTDPGKEILEALALERSYYGFLAADRLGLEYRLDHQPLEVEVAQTEHIAGTSAARRARELLHLHRYNAARREWQWLTRSMDAPALQAAAKLAQHWEWLDQAIFTLARTNYWDDLQLRFPLQYQALVEREATRTKLEVPWIFAIMRQESAFSPSAQSPAGALGLMQLMPKTARSTARQLHRPAPSRTDLFRPDTNITLGTTYLNRVYRKLDAHPVLATAAYNAGPHRVSKWLPEQTLDADIWVELIPFRETRRYVRRVMTYAVIYEKRLGLPSSSVLARMRPISGSLSRVSAMRTAPVVSGT